MVFNFHINLLKSFYKVRINHENKEKKSIIEELTFDLESTDDTEEEKNGGNLSKSSRQKQNKVHILKEKVLD